MERLALVFKIGLDGINGRLEKLDQTLSKIRQLQPSSYYAPVKYYPKEKKKELDSRLPFFGRGVSIDVTSLLLACYTIEQTARAYQEQERFKTLELCIYQLQAIMFPLRPKDSKDVLTSKIGRSYCNFGAGLVLTATSPV